MLLCCRQWNSCRTSCSSSPHSHVFPSRLSQCRRSCLTKFLRDVCVATRSWGNSWWKCRRFSTSSNSGFASRSDDNPVPHGGRGVSGGPQGFLPRHSSSKRTANKITDLPAPRSGVRRLQGFLPEQSSTATSSSFPKRISEQIVEQIAVSREGLQDFLPGQSSSSSSHDPARGSETLDEPGYGVFRTFPHFQKSATQPSHSGSELPPHSSPWTPAAYDASMVLEEEEEEEEEEPEDEPVEFVEYVQHDGLWWGCGWDPAHQRHCLVAGCCRWVTGRPYDMAASMAHRQRAMVTMLWWSFFAGAWFDSGYKFQRLRTAEGASFCSSSKWVDTALLQRQVRTSATCYAAVTCTHSANWQWPIFYWFCW